MILLLYNEKIIYGELLFSTIYGFLPSSIIDLINFEENKINSIVEYEKNKYIINCENVLPKKAWIIKISKEINILEIVFNVNIDDYIISDYNDLNFDFNNKSLCYFNDKLYDEIKEIDLNLVNKNDCFIKEVFINFNEIEFLGLVFYYDDLKKYKIKLKNITEIIKKKTQCHYNTQIVVKQNFLSHIFHEIRNYLNIISITSENILNEHIENLDLSNDIKHIEESTKTIIDILSDIIFIEKINANEIKLRKTNFMINDLFNNCVHSIGMSMKNKNINFIYENKLLNKTMFGDYIKIKQVIINLLSNSVKFCKSNDIICFIIDEEVNNIKFSIKDTGIGIINENKHKLFKPFNQIDPEIIQNGSGSGLGLSISKYIIELHEGEIGFTSELNKGSNFYFNIPKINIECVNEISEKSIVLPKISNKYEMNHKILIVEDNIVIQKLFKKLLLSLGDYEIEIAENGLEAVNKYKKSYNNKNCYTIIFMDQEMPEMDGCLATKKIKEINKHAIIIGITGNVSQLDIKRFLNHGAQEVYKKPITKIEVIELLGKYKILKCNNNFV